MSDRIGIVGGGLLGLGLAERLRGAGNAVTVFEAAPQLGGLAAPWQLGPIAWDKFYHVILQSDSFTQGLIDRLGLRSDFIGVETKTGFFTDGKLHSMSNSLEFLKFPPLGLVGKFRLALTILHASRTTDWKKLERTPLVEWLMHWSGKKTVEKIWKPLLRAKLGESYRIASAAFIWATIQRMYAARKSGLKKELFGYVRGGYGRMIEAYSKLLTESGVELRCASPVARIDSEPGVGPSIELKSGERFGFDKIICTAVPELAAKMIPDLNPAERELFQGVKYQGIVCASVVLKSPLSRFYVTNLTDDWVPFTGVIEMTALVDPIEFGGRTLIYLPKYADANDPIFRESDDSIRDRFLAALEKMYPHFHRDSVEAFQVARVKAVFPIPTLSYSERLPPMKTRLSGVFCANSSHIVNGTLNVNETLQLAERAASLVLMEAAHAPAGV